MIAGSICRCTIRRVSRSRHRARHLAAGRGEAGIHVLCRQHENLLPVQVVVIPATERAAREQVEAYYQRREAWLAELAAGRLERATIRWHPRPLVRFYDEGGPDARPAQRHLAAQAFPRSSEWKR